MFFIAQVITTILIFRENLTKSLRKRHQYKKRPQNQPLSPRPLLRLPQLLNPKRPRQKKELTALLHLSKSRTNQLIAQKLRKIIRTKDGDSDRYVF